MNPVQILRSNYIKSCQNLFNFTRQELWFKCLVYFQRCDVQLCASINCFWCVNNFGFGRLGGFMVTDFDPENQVEKKTSRSVTRELCRRRTSRVLLPVRVVPLQRDRRGRRVRKDLYFCVRLVQNSISSFLFLPGSASAPALVRRLRVVGGQKGRQENVGRGSRGRERSSRRKRSCTLGTGTSGRTWPVFNFIF